ncbi:hypothetical protein C7999DRAFT_35283 [Corynascus novoguineensis]|uniref:NAD-dependent epimerase/dehydratase domain-containing protein n=1 Tax=Corynascus novoguineensis TaxID=1126955 RepID=A0AAN7CP88_9PEZI|nr:hypothetical protein C7999DRAFT_35283 [Corynascus novoguineensis]
MSSTRDTVVSPGSRILVTGVSGFIGSHVADQLLARGYSVTGTTRDASKIAWIQQLFDKKYGTGKFNIVEIADFNRVATFDTVLEGVSGIVHAASDMSMDPDPNKVITPMVDGVRNMLEASARQPSVKRFVFTSSCASAASAGAPPQTVDVDTWNDGVSQAAWAPPPYQAERGFAVYAASKMEAEREAWKWYREHKPHFVLNTVLPSMNFGKSLDPVNQGHPSTSFMVQAVFQGNVEMVENAPQYFFVDVQDNARIHVAALIHPEVHAQRIFAYAAPYTWRNVQRVIQKLYPGKVPDKYIADAEPDKSEIIPAARAEALLKEMGQLGWTSLEDCVKMNTEDLAAKSA